MNHAPTPPKKNTVCMTCNLYFVDWNFDIFVTANSSFKKRNEKNKYLIHTTESDYTFFKADCTLDLTELACN